MRKNTRSRGPQTVGSLKARAKAGALAEGPCATCEGAKVAESTQRGKLQKVRQGRLPRNQQAYRAIEDDEVGKVYVVDEEKMVMVRRILCGIASRCDPWMASA
jgi:hypothetical protein